MGVTLPSLLDFIEATGPTIFTRPEALVNDAAKHTYSFWRFLRGKPMSKVLQGGSEIRDDIMLSEPQTYAEYQTGDVFTYPTSQLLTRWKIDWRFCKDHMAWHDQEVLLNQGSGMSAGAVFQQYKDFWEKLQRGMWTSVYNGMERMLWAVPDKTKMEASDGKTPYSLPCFINEQTDTLFNKQTTAGPGGAWTTVEQIDPTATGKLNWRNQMVGYTDVGIFVPTGGPVTTASRTLIEALDDAIEDVKFIPPNGTKEQYFEDGELDSQVLFTTKKGKNEVRRLQRRDNDEYVSGKADAYNPRPKHAGFDLVRVEQLESTALYKNATTGLVTEGDTNAAGRGPRIYVVNGNYIMACFHALRYFHMTDTLTPYDQPFSHAKVVDIWTNNVCRSRMRQAIVTPGSVAGAYPAQILTAAQVYGAY